MVKISREEYRSLELKIEAEIKKVFSQFIEELESKTAERTEPPVPGRSRSPAVPSPGAEPLPPGPVKHRRAKRSIAINEVLKGTAPAGTRRPGNILESDMDKIFRKKHRRTSR